MLAAKTIGIGTLLDFVFLKTGGRDARAGLHFALMNHRTKRGDEDLLDAAKGHAAFGERNAGDGAHLAVRVEKNFQLLLDGNTKGILDKGVLPGIYVSLLIGEHDRPPQDAS